ncbi:MAG: hypothetical protein ACLRW2_00385 [Parasutterella excrementihominis]
MSEAGCPGVADPGANAAEAHSLYPRRTARRTVFYSFSFNGFRYGRTAFPFLRYLPIKEPARTNAIKDLERKSASSEGETQLFIETPYRNSGMLAILLKTARHDAYSRGHRHLRAGRAHSHVLRSGLEKTGFVAAEAPDGLRNSRR